MLRGKKKKKILTLKFLKDLKNFFEIIEKQTGLKVVVSCSKKIQIQKNLFGKRKNFYGRTLELISKSKLILGIGSDALYQALYNNVPVICLKHRYFSLKRNILIQMKSVTLFNKHASSIEDYILSKKKITFDKDENFYQEILNDYFISSGLKYENFSQKLKEYLMELDNVSNNTIIIAEAGVNHNGKLEYAKETH